MIDSFSKPEDDINFKPPLELTPNSKFRLKENNPIYKWVDYYDADGKVQTMSLEDYKKLL